MLSWINCAYVNNLEILLSTFTHFTYETSNHTAVCCDLQGVKKDGNHYILTDPAINSYSINGYGGPDLGREGIHTVMRNHQCN